MGGIGQTMGTESPAEQFPHAPARTSRRGGLRICYLAILVAASAAVSLVGPGATGSATPPMAHAPNVGVHPSVIIYSDLAVSSPLSSVFLGTAAPFTAVLPLGNYSSSYLWSWGDGTSTSTSAATLSHLYATPGNY